MNICPICTNPFEKNPKKKTQTYCSRVCFFESMRKQVEIICEHCGKPFSVYQARGKARFCSFECRSAKVPVPCEICGIVFYVKRSHQKKRRICSVRCRAGLTAKIKQGQTHTPEVREKVSQGLRDFYNGDPTKHWNYKGGTFSNKRGLSWKGQRNKARQRDNYTCQVCGVTEAELGKQLSVHHISAYRLFDHDSKANGLDNLISTCQSCHMKLEHGTVTIPIK